MRFACAFRTSQVNDLNLRRSDLVTSCLNVAIVDLHIDSEDGVRASALCIHFSLCYHSNLFTEPNLLNHFIGRVNNPFGQIFDNDFSVVIPDIKVALFSIEQIVHLLVINFHVADTDCDLALDETLTGDSIRALG